MRILKLYLTSLEPDIEQNIYSQSIGGYCSNSLLYPETTLSSTVGLYDESFTLNIPSSGSWSGWTGIESINIGNEIIQISPFVNSSVSVVQRGVNNIVNMHIEGDYVWASSSKELFNDVFNDTYKQYRCLALKNVSASVDPSANSSIAEDISIYFKQNSRNTNSTIRIGLEQPASQYITGTSTEWSSMQLVDESLAGGYSDNIFKEAYLKILDGEAIGQGKIISSFDSSTGTFTFYNSFSSDYDFSADVKYEVLPSPSQRIKTGTESPSLNGENMLDFSNPVEYSPLRFFSADGSTFTISDLNFNNIMYLWIEREVQKGSEEFLNNDFTLNINYKEV
jgi:hypothetical protein